MSLYAIGNPVSPQPKSIVFHLGAHKTASSFLATLLKRHARQLRNQGFMPINRKAIMKSGFYQAVMPIGDSHQGEPSSLAASRASFQEFFDGEAPNLLFANEDMIHRIEDVTFYANATRKMRFIREVAGDIPVRVILYTRSQPDYLESVYLQFMHLGRSVSFDRFLKRRPSNQLAWTRVLDELADAIGRENVTAMPYESIHRLGSLKFYHEFLRAWGVDKLDEFQLPEQTELSRAANRSYSGEALKIARFVNPMLDHLYRKKLRKFLQEHFSTATHPRAKLFSPDDRREVLASVADSNAALFETWLREWPEERRYYF